MTDFFTGKCNTADFAWKTLLKADMRLQDIQLHAAMLQIFENRPLVVRYTLVLLSFSPASTVFLRQIYEGFRLVPVHGRK
jgi:hypothetical protein